MFYNLYNLGDGNELVPTDVNGWSTWRLFNQSRCYVGFHQSKELRLDVSTVFVGLGPLPFETLVTFEGDELARHHWATWAEAEAGHSTVIRELTASDEERRVDSLVSVFTEQLSKVVSKVP